MTLRKAIENVFNTSPTGSHTCKEVCQWLIIDGFYKVPAGYTNNQLIQLKSSGVSFKLLQMKNAGLLEYDNYRWGPRGGASYKMVEQ